MLLGVSVSQKPSKDISFTGLRAKPRSETTTVIAPISTNSFGATGTGQPHHICISAA